MLTVTASFAAASATAAEAAFIKLKKV